MGEIDTKPIKPVQVALSFFGDKGVVDQKKHQNSSSCPEDMDEEKDAEVLLKELANYKVKLESKESDHLELLLKLEHYQQTCEELSTLLKDSDSEKNAYIEECREARFRIDELKSKMKEVADQRSETGLIKEHLSHILCELKATQVELLGTETELAAANEAKLKALSQAELMETAAEAERVRVEGLLRNVSELNEAIMLLKLDAIGGEQERSYEKDAKMEGEQIETKQEFENQTWAKSVFVDTLQVELNQANELLSSSDKAVSDAINELNQLKAEFELKEKENSDQASYIGALVTEIYQLKLELENANHEISELNRGARVLKHELLEAKIKIDQIKGKENEAQVEIALLKSEVHRARSRLAGAEARAGSTKSSLYLAAQKENQLRKQGADSVEFKDFELQDTQLENPSQATRFSQANEPELVDRTHENNSQITISREEYEFLARKVKRVGETFAESSNKAAAATTSQSNYEMEILKKELDDATAKIAEFRTRAEQAITRAEAAEKAKSAYEDQVKRRKQHKQKRKAALAALKEESYSRELSAPPCETTSYQTYQPLGKVLNMEF